MNPKWIKLAAEMLEAASEKYSNHGCNDWEWPKDWTAQDREEFAKALDNTEGQTGYFEETKRTNYGPPDYLVMSFLADWLKRQAIQEVE